MYIAIEGNAGTGKTTLTMAIAEALGMSYALEPGEKELTLWYQEIGISPLRVQVYCLAHRLQRQIEIKAKRSYGIISDFVLVKDRVYAEVWLQSKDFKAYLSLFNAVNFWAEKPDLLIYLDAPIEFLVWRLQKRGRSFEGFVNEEFLARLGELTKKHVLALNVPNTVVLDSTTFDVLSNPGDLDRIIHSIGLKL